jgi:RNA polymerase sigma-70 factor, ECF subfamily
MTEVMPSPVHIPANLIDACRAGDPKALEDLVAACRDRVYSLAWHLGGSETLAGDIAQDVLVKLLTRVGQFRHEAEFATWLYRIVANTAADYRRARRRLRPVEEAGDRMEPPMQERRYARAETAAQVRDALARLPARFRVPLVLRYMEGLSYEQIGHVLRVSPGTVASRLSRGLQRLGHELRPVALDFE